MTTQSDIIIERLGGIERTAELAGAAFSTVYRWTQPKEKGGTAGVIPKASQAKLIAGAAKKGIALTEIDFVEATLTALRNPAPESSLQKVQKTPGVRVENGGCVQ